MGHSVRNKYFVLRNMTSVDDIVAIRVNETSWAHVWRLHFCYLGTGCDSLPLSRPHSLVRRQSGISFCSSEGSFLFPVGFCYCCVHVFYANLMLGIHPALGSGFGSHVPCPGPLSPTVAGLRFQLLWLVTIQGPRLAQCFY
jgi:hypothetical protein